MPFFSNAGTRHANPLALIQLFGRWGSTAVMRYVKDAILGLQGGSIAQVTEKLGKPLAAMEEQMLGRLVKLRQPAAKPFAAEAWSAQGLESLAGRLLPLVMTAMPAKDYTQELSSALAPIERTPPRHPGRGGRDAATVRPMPV